jgi:sec-independent protein translocase protein TatB
MNVFGVGPLELIVVLILALVVVGPDRLPRLAADLARTIREIRRYTASFASEFNEVIREFERETETERSDWKEIGQGLNEASQSVNEAISGARRDAEGPPTPLAPPAPAAAAEPANGAASANGETSDDGWRDITPPPLRANGAAETPPVEKPR